MSGRCARRLQRKARFRPAWPGGRDGTPEPKGVAYGGAANPLRRRGLASLLATACDRPAPLATNASRLQLDFVTVPGSAWSEPGHLDSPINMPSADQSPALRLTRNRKMFGVEKARRSLLPFFLSKSACSCFSKMFPRMFPQHTTPHDTRGAR